MTALAAAARLVADRRRAAIAITVPIAGLSVLALAGYPGTPWRGALFCTVAGGLVPLGVLAGRSPFRLLACGFLALGFWAKFVAHFALGVELVEPMGAFPGTAEAWDAALVFATSGLAGVWVVLIATWRLGIAGRRVPPRVDGPARATPPAPAGDPGLILLAASAAVAVAVFVVNHHYAILRVGFVPRLDLHPYLYVAIAFPVTWGILLWLLALAWWLVERGRLPPAALAHIAALEGAAAALSMGSRAQMLLHATAGGFALWHGLRCRGWTIPRRGWLAIAGVFAPLFAATLLLVSIDRALTFPPKSAASGHAARAGTAATAAPPPPPRQAPVDRADPRPGGAGTPAGAGAGAAKLPRPPAAPAAADTALRRVNTYHRLRTIPVHVGRLFVLRWVGLEGVMAAVSSDAPLGRPLFREALLEQPSAGIDAIYQRMARSIYPRSDRFVFLTIPGPVAFAAFTGSVAACFAIVAALMLAGVLLEAATARLTHNPAAGAVAGVALAYLLAQLNFPRTLWFFALELIGAALLVAAVGPWLRGPARRAAAQQGRRGAGHGEPSRGQA